MSGYTIERKRSDCSALPKGWQREEVARKAGMAAPGKMDVYYYSPSGQRIETKPELMRHLGNAAPADWSTFDYRRGEFKPTPAQPVHRAFERLGKKLPDGLVVSGPLPPHMETYRLENHRTDAALVPPIRQTASIFKQPVTVYKQQESIVKTDLKHGANQEKPKQLFWEKRLEGMRACDDDGREFAPVKLPRNIQPVGPNVDDDTALQSVATALHCASGNGSGNATTAASAAAVGANGGATTLTGQPVVGQMGPRDQLDANPAVYLNPGQPLIVALDVSEEDIRRQEDLVGSARKRLQEFLDRQPERQTAEQPTEQ